jgi:hypothetical protein
VIDWNLRGSTVILLWESPICCTSSVTLVSKIEVLASSVGSAEHDSCKEKS